MNTFEALMRHGAEKVSPLEIAPTEDPLRVADVLREAQILDVWCDCATQTVGILLEMRMAFIGGDRYAALIVGRGVRDVAWKSSEATNHDNSYSFGRAWNVASSVVEPMGLFVALDLDCIPAARLRIRSSRFEYFLAEVPGLDPAPPDYGEGPDDLVRANLPDWRRPITLVGSSRRAID